MTTFADSYYFFALLNSRDPGFAKATEFLKTYSGQLVTTGWVLTEVGDGLCRLANRSAFLLTVETLENDPNVEVVAFDDELFRAGVELFRNRPDKEWSLTDCISFVIMKREAIQEALTADHHFEQAGFRAILK